MAVTKVDHLPLQHCPVHSGYRKECDACKAQKRIYNRAWHAQRDGTQNRLPAEGTIRRLDALARLGYSRVEVAEMLGTTRGNVLRLRTQRKVSRTMAERVDRLYRKLENTPVNRKLPHRRGKAGMQGRIVRTKATKAGYAPPFAWDDIDQDEAPQGMEPPAFMRVNEKLEEAAFLKSYGLTEEVIAARLGVTVATLRSWSYPSQRERRNVA